MVNGPFCNPFVTIRAVGSEPCYDCLLYAKCSSVHQLSIYSWSIAITCTVWVAGGKAVTNRLLYAVRMGSAHTADSRSMAFKLYDNHALKFGLDCR